ncbi:SGNH hydrolase [Aureobasidium namibiae CBS 147.97]|uniref:SGNH hydrolase n=1 Tax=Aureobasidium namibiae CBS 147.97 TaxID=1043004 RepID=A0A074WPV2_9PEZI|nr:SGNH hydrolase [Aureobasidium namibiae CBS 147.97]KEQ75180.1 SGNH hydrolase [Aureobasidium namibiae CBS 147.97]
MAIAKYDQFVFFGDSITQLSYAQDDGFGFLAAIASDYNRAVDIVCRGFAGANTRDALELFPQFFPSADEGPSVRLLVIFFGANDSVLEGTAQHVPLLDFRENLISLATHESIRAHPEVSLVFITPPPKSELMLKRVHEEYANSSKENGQELPQFAQHSQAVTHAYANTVKEVGQELNIPVVDLWSAITGRLQTLSKTGVSSPGGQGVGGGESKWNFGQYLCDGVHLTGKGYKVLYEEFCSVIRLHYPGLSADNMHRVFQDNGNQAPFVLRIPGVEK